MTFANLIMLVVAILLTVWALLLASVRFSPFGNLMRRLLPEKLYRWVGGEHSALSK